MENSTNRWNCDQIISIYNEICMMNTFLANIKYNSHSLKIYLNNYYVPIAKGKRTCKCVLHR